MYAKLWNASGMPYAALFDRLIENAFRTHTTKAALIRDYLD